MIKSALLSPATLKNLFVHRTKTDNVLNTQGIVEMLCGEFVEFDARRFQHFLLKVLGKERADDTHVIAGYDGHRMHSRIEGPRKSLRIGQRFSPRVRILQINPQQALFVHGHALPGS
ncbi:MAG: hypothetical protein ACI9DC_003523 [Gammaproteobacteria bacterium]|jgi:hypothetical protein